MGLGDGVTPVLYDHQDGRNAAMATWVLEYLGRKDVHVMDRLYEAWKQEGREVLYRPVATEAKTFTPRLIRPSAPPWTTSPVLLKPALPEAAPARPNSWTPASTEEFRGEVEMDHRPGRIPGAINIPHSEMGGADGKLLIKPAALHQRLSAAGIATGDPVVAYCRSGVRASLAYLAMKQAGYDIRLYDASYSEWMDSAQAVEV